MALISIAVLRSVISLLTNSFDIIVSHAVSRHRANKIIMRLTDWDVILLLLAVCETKFCGIIDLTVNYIQNFEFLT